MADLGAQAGLPEQQLQQKRPHGHLTPNHTQKITKETQGITHTAPTPTPVTITTSTGTPFKAAPLNHSMFTICPRTTTHQYSTTLICMDLIIMMGMGIISTMELMVTINTQSTRSQQSLSKLGAISSGSQHQLQGLLFP